MGGSGTQDKDGRPWIFFLVGGAERLGGGSRGGRIRPRGPRCQQPGWLRHSTNPARWAASARPTSHRRPQGSPAGPPSGGGSRRLDLGTSGDAGSEETGTPPSSLRYAPAAGRVGPRRSRARWVSLEDWGGKRPFSGTGLIERGALAESAKAARRFCFRRGARRSGSLLQGGRLQPQHIGQVLVASARINRHTSLGKFRRGGAPGSCHRHGGGSALSELLRAPG